MPDNWWRTEQRPFFILTFSLLLVLVVPALVREGMFMDGMIYATVAKKLANGTGTLWNLELYNPQIDSYRDQPPLGIWIQSLFFLIFGNSIYTERIFSFFTLVVNGLLIMKLWKVINRNSETSQQIGWLPVVFWIIIPVCFWSFSNNMMENTLSIFILLSVIFIFKNFQTQHVQWLIISGVFLFLAGMTKGVQALFPACFPFMLFIVFRQGNGYSALFKCMMLLMIPAFLFLLIIQIPEAKIYFEDYFSKRLVYTFTAAEFQGESRIHLLKKLIEALIVPVILAIILQIGLRAKTKLLPQAKKVLIAFSFLALSGTIPLMVTKEQRRFYLVPVLPFYAIAIASLVESKIKDAVISVNANDKSRKILNGFSVLILVSVISYSAYSVGKPGRDAELIKEVKEIGKYVPEKSTVKAETWIANRYGLRLYLERYYDISLYEGDYLPARFLLTTNHQSEQATTNFKEIETTLTSFRLFLRNDQY